MNEAGEAGLLGLALDPQFAQNRYVYVAYTDRSPEGGLRNRLVRLREDPATGKGVLDKLLIDNVPANSNHDGGRVKFGPDGKLYWTMGEAQNMTSAQDLKTLSGKILRINPDGTIPADNPIPGSPIYSYGHRNPQGLAWQPGTNRLYATEHGPSGEKGCCQDEVELDRAGQELRLADHYRRSEASGHGLAGDPKHDQRDLGADRSNVRHVWAVAGLHALHRPARPDPLSADARSGRSGQSRRGWSALFAGQYGRLRDVAEGPDGAIYILTSNGDGRGNLPPDGDRVLRLSFAAP